MFSSSDVTSVEFLFDGLLIVCEVCCVQFGHFVCSFYSVNWCFMFVFKFLKLKFSVFFLCTLVQISACSVEVFISVNL